jgi:PAS domain S-box-containing protein
MPPMGKSVASSDQPVVLRYAGAAMAALAALGVRIALDPVLGSHAPYIPFVLAIVVASRYGGRGPGLAATAISTLAVDWFYLQPRDSLAINDPNAAAGLVLFLLAGIIISLLVGRLRTFLLSAARAEPAIHSAAGDIRITAGELGGATGAAGRGAGRKLKSHHLWLGSAVLLLAIESLLFFGTWMRFAERESMSVRAREVQAKIESLLSELKDAETGQRGYLLTGRDYYLEPYNLAVREIPGRLEDLRKVAVDQGQQARLVSLRPLVATELAELKETIDLRRTGGAAAALQALSTDRGKQTMDQIRDAIAAMQAAEASLLEDRSQRAVAAARGIGFVMVSGAGLLLIVLLAGSRNIDRNLTRRQEAQERLRASEEKFARAFASNPAAVAIARLEDGLFLDVNETWQALNGYRREEVIGRRAEDIHMWPAPEDRPRFVSELKANGSLHGWEQTFRKKSGATYDVILSAAVVTLEGQQAVIAMSVDVTEKRRAEEALRESEAQFRMLANAIPQLCWMANGDGWIFWYNEGWYKYTGTTPEQMAGWGWQSVHDSEALPDVMARWKESLAKGEPFEMVFPLRGADGIFRLFLTRVTPVRGQDGKVARWFGTNTDISGQRKIEEALRASLERLERVLEVETVGVMFWDLNTGCMVDANDTFLRVMGYSRGQVEARELTWQKLTPPEYFDMSRREVEKFLATGRVGPYEKEYFRKDGTRLWLLFAGSSLGSNQCVEFCVDISERKKAEAALRESEGRFRNLFDSMDEGFAECEMIYDADGRPIDFKYLAVNPAFGTASGLPVEGVMGRTVSEVIPGIESSWIESYGRVVQTGESQRIANPVAALGRHFEVYAWRSGPGRFATVFSDVTERKRAEESLLRMSAIVESSDDAIIGKTLEGVITSWNLGAARLYGYSAPEILGRHISALVPPGHPDELPSILRRLAKGDRVEQMEAVRRRKDGSLVDVSLKISPIVDASGSVVGASTIARDITERKRAEEEIRRLNADLEGRVRRRTAQLEAANKELEAFAYSVSHDLRTPLRGIDGWSLALVEDYASQLDERAHGYLDRVRAETQRMGTLIDDLLQLSRVTRSEMATGAVDLTSLARTIASRLTENNSGRRIEFTIAGGLAASGDARLLEIALENLFGNAVKFTGPRTEARIEFGRTEGAGQRAFYVRDNGVGFDMAFMGTLFGAFQRLHKSSEFPGTGIGLATVQRIIHRHGGRVWAEAQPDRGATFYFTLGES